MKDLKNLMVVLLTILATLTASAVTTVRKSMPKISDEDKLISLKDRFYYFDDNDLHCYDIQNGTDTKIEAYYAGPNFTLTAWYDKESDCIYLVENAGGNVADSQTVYKLTNKHILTPMVSLTGAVGDVTVSREGDTVFLKGIVDEYSPLNIPDVKNGDSLNAFYSTGLKPWRFSRHSLGVLKRPELDFYGVIAPDVNVRAYGDPKAPRLGFFKPRPGFEDEGAYLQTEDADIDTQIFTRSFIPWHPEVGTVFVSNSQSYSPEGWTNIIVDNYRSESQVSSKFVKKIDNEPLTSMTQFAESDLKERVYKMNSAKYPGLWVMVGELPDCGEPPLLLGKEVNGMVVFRWRAGWPVCSGESGKRFDVDESGFVQYGSALTKNDYELDLSKVNDSDIDALLKVIAPSDHEIPILVKIPELGIGTFNIPARYF